MFMFTESELKSSPSSQDQSGYLTGFGNALCSEAVAGALPIGRNSPQQAPLGWRFESGHAGKPALKAPAPCHFNLSHSGDAIAVAVADQPVGLDIESHRELNDGLAIAQRVFHPRERQWLQAQADFAAGFYRLWTLKEALLKATGEGFTQAPEAL